MAEKKLKKGDHVEWNTSQGSTKGTVKSKVTGKAKAGGHTAQASPDEPQFEVESDKTGKTAIHKADALKKIPAAKSPQKES
ncbi:MAG TPA: DUF2945 domain-containing protein [Abditibacteriaceae bacterium]